MEQLEGLLKGSAVVVGLRYQGLTVKQLQEFRRSLPKDSKMLVGAARRGCGPGGGSPGGNSACTTPAMHATAPGVQSGQKRQPACVASWRRAALLAEHGGAPAPVRAQAPPLPAHMHATCLACLASTHALLHPPTSPPSSSHPAGVQEHADEGGGGARGRLGRAQARRQGRQRVAVCERGGACASGAADRRAQRVLRPSARAADAPRRGPCRLATARARWRVCAPTPARPQSSPTPAPRPVPYLTARSSPSPSRPTSTLRRSWWMRCPRRSAPRWVDWQRQGRRRRLATGGRCRLLAGG